MAKNIVAAYDVETLSGNVRFFDLGNSDFGEDAPIDEVVRQLEDLNRHSRCRSKEWKVFAHLTLYGYPYVKGCPSDSDEAEHWIIGLPEESNGAEICRRQLGGLDIYDHDASLKFCKSASEFQKLRQGYSKKGYGNVNFHSIFRDRYINDVASVSFSGGREFIHLSANTYEVPSMCKMLRTLGLAAK